MLQNMLAQSQSPPHWAYATHKGGVGKTLLLQATAAAAAEVGHQVLVVDMDPQSNATRRLRARVPQDPEQRAAVSLAAVLGRPSRGDVAGVIAPCGWGGLYTESIMVAPGHLQLELLASTAAHAASERRLLTALAGVVDDYDVVLIDCPPNLLSHLIDNAWTASDLLWVPTEPEYDSVEAARRVHQRVIADRDTLNPDLEIGGLIVNRYRSSLTLHQQRAGEVAAILGGDSVCPVRLPELVAIKNASEHAAPLRELGSGGRDMAALARDMYAWMRQRTESLSRVPA
jgi:chromosome partitioning protein